MSEDTAEATAPTATGVTINDIALLIQIIEVVAQRGAFKAEELSSVGAVYDKVKTFITNAMPPQQPEEGTNQ